MLLLISKLWITIFALDFIGSEFSLVEVDRVLDKHVSAEVFGQVSGAFNAHNVVNLAVQKVFRYLGQIVLLEFWGAVGIDRDYVNKQAANALVVGSD